MIWIVEQDTGHRSLPHTADVIVEAWAPSLSGCLEEAVMALVEQYVEPSASMNAGRRSFDVAAGEEAGLLVAVLEEVVYMTEVEGLVPIGVTVDSVDATGARGEFRVVDVTEAVQTGSVPKAVSRRDLELVRTSSGWRCRATIDV